MEEDMSRMEYRVTWRRWGNRATQSRVMGLRPAVNKFVQKLRDDRRWAPLEDLTIQQREVGRWEVIWSMAVAIPDEPLTAPAEVTDLSAVIDLRRQSS
jgi:hypothetical protein